MGDSSETNKKVLSRELFLGVVALKTPIPQNHYLRDKVPFRKSGHILCKKVYIIMYEKAMTRSVWSGFDTCGEKKENLVFSLGITGLKYYYATTLVGNAHTLQLFTVLTRTLWLMSVHYATCYLN